MTNTTTSRSTNTSGTAKVSEIKFRNKFTSVITDNNRSSILKAFQKFLRRAPDSAVPFLWKLTCCDRTENFEGLLETLGLEATTVAMESRSLLCSELRYQYSLVHPDFLDVTAPEDCLPALQALKDKVSDSIAVYMVTQKIREFLLVGTPAFFEQTMNLLDAEEEAKYFGGIRSLKFGYPAAIFLKPFHTEIANLFRALWEHKKSKEEDSKNLPFKDLDARVKKAGIVLAEEATIPATEATVNEASTLKAAAPQTHTIEPQANSKASTVEVTPKSTQETMAPASASVASEERSEFTALTADLILAHRSLFEQLLVGRDKNVWYQIGMLGLDLNTVFEKTQSIQTLLTATAAF